MNFTQEQWPFEKGPCDPIRSHQIHSMFSIFVSFRTLSKSRIAISHLLPFANSLSKVAYLSFASESLGIEFLNKTVPAVVIVTLSVVWWGFEPNDAIAKRSKTPWMDVSKIFWLGASPILQKNGENFAINVNLFHFLGNGFLFVSLAALRERNTKLFMDKFYPIKIVLRLLVPFSRVNTEQRAANDLNNTNLVNNKSPD